VVSTECKQDDDLKSDPDWTHSWSGSFYGTIDVKWLILCCDLPGHSVIHLIKDYIPQVIAARARE